jgi:hypothetical protein
MWFLLDWNQLTYSGTSKSFTSLSKMGWERDKN